MIINENINISDYNASVSSKLIQPRNIEIEAGNIKENYFLINEKEGMKYIEIRILFKDDTRDKVYKNISDFMVNFRNEVDIKFNNLSHNYKCYLVDSSIDETDLEEWLYLNLRLQGYEYDNIISKEIKKTPIKARYIRDYCNGNSSDPKQCNWTEIKVINTSGVNVALNKTLTSNISITNASVITDNIYENKSQFATGKASNNTIPYVQIDLGKVNYDIDEIKVWHYYSDARRYHKTKTEISEDGLTWVTLFDSDVSGEYVETQYGHSIKGNGAHSNGDIYKNLIVNKGNLKSPCIVEITPTIDMIDFKIGGLSDQPIIIKNLKKNSKIIIDGIVGTVKVGNENKFNDTEMWEFPILSPGVNDITLSRSECSVIIKYYPRFM